MMINPSHAVHDPSRARSEGATPYVRSAPPTNRFTDHFNDIHRDDEVRLPDRTPAARETDTRDLEETEATEESRASEALETTDEASEAEDDVAVAVAPAPIPDVPEKPQEATPAMLASHRHNPHARGIMGSVTITTDTPTPEDPGLAANLPQMDTLESPLAEGNGEDTVGESASDIAFLNPGAESNSPVSEDTATPDLLTESVDGSEEVAAAFVPPTSTTDGNPVDSGLTTTEESEHEPRPPQPLIRQFPRTLNALFAEQAVRARQSTATSVQQLVNELAEVSEPVPTQGTGDEPPPPSTAPTSPTAALEGGGVRVASTQAGPRIPLSNLPGEMAQQIHRIQQEGATTLHLRISPESLGDLRLEVHREGDAIRVAMVSNNPQVREALEGQLSDLRRALSQQGFDLLEASVEDGNARRNESDSASRQTTRNDRQDGSLPPPSHGEPLETLQTAVRESARITSDSINVLA